MRAGGGADDGRRPVLSAGPAGLQWELWVQ